MQNLQISDQAANQLNDMAKQAHISSAELVDRLIKKHRETLIKQPEYLAEFAGLLSDSPSFIGNPLDIQKAMRNEWD